MTVAAITVRAGISPELEAMLKEIPGLISDSPESVHQILISLFDRVNFLSKLIAVDRNRDAANALDFSVVFEPSDFFRVFVSALRTGGIENMILDSVVDFHGFSSRSGGDGGCVETPGYHQTREES